MILQSSYVVVGCPICGRPLEMQSIFIGQKVRCGHCSGELVVRKSANGSLISRDSNGNDSLRRAEQLLCALHESNSSDSHRPGPLSLPQASRLDDKKQGGSIHCTSPHNYECEEKPQATILLVEHRDEVFARLATDIAEFGILVIRAKSATEAINLYDKYRPTLIVGNVNLPYQSVWLMTAKLRLFDRRLCVWLYQHQSSSYRREIASFLSVDELLPYQGDLLGLSERIIDLMEKRSESNGGAGTSDWSEESGAA